ncbi:dTDP-glucose 4,6-dehydratase [Lentilactobacillus fungorum]|uniref:dTDP-glucose 4,6-dehydratase n=1 Tax=Lentilactobacillus fungorum TaxID=2201250 RepID=A0ABQ3VXP0_9LACO|nr:dTDP-glucose 4,6-dehydratase [Lentilactobacillus fungorum]GHP13062.1 dTDP-glucose 4,6-dehydratase [Lentilactobacillus fungorum]
MHLLVTGGAGFIGSNFIHYLLTHSSVERIVNFDCLTYAGNLENNRDIEDDARYAFVHGNITDSASVNAAIDRYQIDAIVNFAAESHVDRSILNSQAFVASNFAGVSVLLDCVRAKGISKFVQVSTDEVYGSAKGREQFLETSALNPSSPYAATKAGADLLVLAAFKTYGLNVSITRSANNYGRYQFPEKLIPLMIAKGMLGEQLPVYGNGQNVRDWLNVVDNCRAIDMVLRHGVAGEVYNVAAHQYRTNLAIVSFIAKRLGVADTQIAFVRDRPANDQLYAINDDKIRTQLGWAPKVNFKTGLAETVDWYAAHLDWWRPLLSRVKNR